MNTKQNVTLICIDCDNPDAAVQAMQYSMQHISFADAVLLSDRKITLPNVIRHEQISKIASQIQYNLFMLKHVHKYIKTTHFLVIQKDGFVLNPWNWNDDWLKLDYIGAPWQPGSPCGSKSQVGNGGFSLRSQKIHKFIAEIATADRILEHIEREGGLWEDHFICRDLFDDLDSNGFIFADPLTASFFSIESPIQGLNTSFHDSFGFHGRICEQTQRIDSLTRKGLMHPKISRILRGSFWQKKNAPLEPSAKRPIEIRNLIYHVCPLKNTDEWKVNLLKLKENLSAFNGKRVIAVACDENTHAITDVHAIIGDNVDLFQIENDPVLRETASFKMLLESVKNTDDNEATFYGHSKAVSTAQNPVGAKAWRNMMYSKLLKEWPECMSFLNYTLAVGTTVIAWDPDNMFPWPSGLQYGLWMFAGTFFWFRHDAVFASKAWRKIPMDRYGTEAWLSGVLSEHEITSVYQPWDFHEKSANPYLPDHYKEFIE